MDQIINNVVLLFAENGLLFLAAFTLQTAEGSKLLLRNYI